MLLAFYLKKKKSQLTFWGHEEIDLSGETTRCNFKN
jgi:hypothetical protein